MNVQMNAKNMHDTLRCNSKKCTQNKKTKFNDIKDVIQDTMRSWVG